MTESPFSISAGLPRRSIAAAFIAAALVEMASTARADDAPATPQPRPTVDAIRRAVDRSLPLLVAGAKGSLEQRKQCFTCHNQGLAIMALSAAQSKGFEVDAEHLQTQLQFTADFLAKNTDRYREGRGQGGEVDTAGYALWTLDIGRWPHNETAAAVVEYLLKYQADDDHWQPRSHRPPAEHSPFTTSYVALRALNKFGAGEQQERIAKRVAQVRDWLLKTRADETEDHVFRLRALEVVDASADEIQKQVDALLALQRTDGGWGQLPDLDCDAYATGTVLLALHEAGDVQVDTPAYQRGLQYLISAQLDDGSWHVRSRAKPFQAYFESGYPHGKDQFISIQAAGWATTALVAALPSPLVESK